MQISLLLNLPCTVENNISLSHTALILLGKKRKCSHEFLCNPTRRLTEHVHYIISVRGKATHCQLLLPLFRLFFGQVKASSITRDNPNAHKWKCHCGGIFRQQKFNVNRIKHLTPNCFHMQSTAAYITD